MFQEIERSSRLSGFYQKSIEERTAIVAAWADLSDAETGLLREALALEQADKMIENVVGRYSLPLGVAANFRINGRDCLIPLVIEEPSVVAAVSFAARLARRGGGFCTGSSAPVMIAQVQLLDVADPKQAETAILAAKSELLRLADVSPTISRMGGGPREIQVRHLPDTPTGPMLIVHLLYDVRDAMGANVVNTAAEAVAPRLEGLSGGRALLRILSNLSDQRRAWAEVVIPADAFTTEQVSGVEVIENIAAANAFAVADPYRAVTHNKGIMNGVDAVALATGNDWRAIEAGAHAWAARGGRYQSLTQWQVVRAASELPWSQDSQTAARLALADRDYPALCGRAGNAPCRGCCGRRHPCASPCRRGAQNLGHTKQPGAERDHGRGGAGAEPGRVARARQRRHPGRAHEPSRSPGCHRRRRAGRCGRSHAAQMAREGQVRVERAKEIIGDRR